MKAFAILLIIASLFYGSCIAQFWGNSHHNNPSSSHDAVLLESITALTFNKGDYTTGRRTSPLPQLTCGGGNAKYRSDLQPDVVQCKKVGSDGAGNIQWHCEADLDKDVKFGKTVVSCEGFSHPDDPYILRGSCALEYTLDFTSHASSRTNPYGSSYGSNTYQPGATKSSSLSSWIGYIILGAVIYGIYRQCVANTQRTYGTGFTAASAPGYTDGYQGYPQTGNTYNAYPNTNTGGWSSWRPGFWSGLGGGSVLGWMMGGNRGYQRPFYSRPWGWGNTGYNTGYNTGTGYNNTAYGNPSAPSFDDRRSPNGTRNASAYATTTRR